MADETPSHTFPVSNVDAWFYGNLDNTEHSRFFKENPTTYKRLERMDQVLVRQNRYNEFVRVAINSLWAEADRLQGEIDAANGRIDDVDGRVDETNTQIEALKTAMTALSARIDAVEERNTYQDCLIIALQNDTILLKSQYEDLANRTSTNRTDIMALDIRVSAIEQDKGTGPLSTPLS